MLTELEQRHIETHFPDINPVSVQGRLGMGIEKVAYALHGMREGFKQSVLKLLRKDTQSDPISYFVSPMFTTPVDEVQRDTDMCVEYFGNSVVVPHIVKSHRDDTYCLLQERLEMQMLTPDLCVRHPQLLDQLKELLEQNKKLQTDEHLFFDFQGWDLWRVLMDQIAMANVAVVWEADSEHTQKPRLKIFDLTLMHMPKFSVRGIVHAPAYLSNERNNHRMVQVAEQGMGA